MEHLGIQLYYYCHNQKLKEMESNISIILVYWLISWEGVVESSLFHLFFCIGCSLVFARWVMLIVFLKILALLGFTFNLRNFLNSFVKSLSMLWDWVGSRLVGNFLGYLGFVKF